MHILTKPWVFYDDTHKQALGYQNPFHLKKAQRIQPTLYDGSVIAKEHAVIFLFDDEETLILEEESRSKMLDKQNDLILIEKKIKISPIDYSKLNKIKEDFGKRFVTKKELPAEQAFWLKHSSFSKTLVTSHTPVRIEAPSELPKRTTSDAITAGAWGFEHTKACFVTEIILFLKVLKDTFNAFDKTLLDEITEVQTIFKQMEAAVDQCSIDKNAFEIQIKQLSIDNDQLLKQIMSQEIVHIAVNFMDSFDVKKSCVNVCNKCLEFKTKLLKKKDLIEKDVYDKLLKSYSTLEKYCISLELTTQLNQEVFQKDNFRLKSLSEKDSLENVKKDIDKIETINIELEHTQRPIGRNRKDTVVKQKEHCDSLIAQINAKSVENSDLNAQLQEKVFSEIGYSWKPTSKTFTIVGNKCSLTRITSTRVVPTKETSTKSVATPTQGILVYSKKPKETRSVGSSSKVKIVESKTSNSKEPKPSWGSTVSDVPFFLWYLDSSCSKNMTSNHSQLINFVSKFLGTVRFGNDHIAKIKGYKDYQMGNVTIS
ncbi:hypothetical protein Tco_0151970 [Tanacetum coccineum]